MQAYAGTSEEQQYGQLQAAGVAEQPFLFYYYGKQYHGIMNPTNEDLKVVGEYYVGKNVPGGTIPLRGPPPTYKTCVQLVHPFNSAGISFTSKKWLKDVYNVRQI